MPDQIADSSSTPASAESSAQTPASLPHFALRPGGARPPAKPFFKVATSAEKSVADKAALERQSGDRSFIERMGVMAPTSSYTPPPQRRVTEIPNLAAARAAEPDVDGKKLVIGKHIKVTGEISGCDKLHVDGRVDAAMNDIVTLDVSVGGVVSGSATVERAVIAGIFDGTLIVRGDLDVTATGSVRGTISYKNVTVAAGGKLSGNITLLDA
ncbi:MAG: polymer-forming cytoskeletal protein [Rhodospirillaceae bacterium]|nr:polymer-forming cytoskeletal protein [Rhodospirillaceae bacterium]